ncbi:MAG: DUF4349 domain-containing protein [Lutispora sp.]|nr:DUF4349 domain-containing protein [Lutispora sp.]
MDCELARSLMSSYIDKDINEIDKIELEKHLDCCADCMEDYQMLLSTVRYCNELEEIELPDTFHQDLRQKLQELGHNKVNKRFFNQNWSWVAGVAAVFIVAVIGISSLPGLNIGSSKATKEDAAYGVPQFTARSGGAEPAAEPAAPEEGKREILQFSESMAASPGMDQAAGFALNNEVVTFDKANESKQQSFERKIITNGSVSLEVTDFDDKMERISELAEKNGGYVENSNVENNVYYRAEGKSDKLKTGSITLRIPAAKFSSTVEEVKALGEVINHNSNSVDITDQYYDTTVRVDNLKVQETRLRELVAMAKNVEEILKIENELNRVRSDIELMSTDIKRWDKQVDLSSLYVNMREVKEGKLETVNVPTIWTKAHKGFIKAVNSIIRGMEALFVFVVTSLPYIVILAIVLVIVYFVVRKIRAKGIK